MFVCEPNVETNEIKNNEVTETEREFKINQQNFRIVAKSYLHAVYLLYIDRQRGKEQQNVSHCMIHLKRTEKITHSVYHIDQFTLWRILAHFL